MYTNDKGQQIVTGDGTWPFHAIVDGDDLVVGKDMDVFTTWFGGSSDPMDSGETACGYPTKGHPELLGCALPLAGYGVKSLSGSPLPKMPFGLHSDGTKNENGTFVRVYSAKTDLDVTVPLIDLGPSKSATTKASEPHAIDLTVAAFRMLGLQVSAGIGQVAYRIIGGAKYLHGG